jgi:hypothetical protein
MTEGRAGEGRRLLDDAVARARALGTAWVRHDAPARWGAPGAWDLRLEGAVDLGRRICVAGESEVGPAAALSAEPRRVVYAGGSRYIAGEDGWEKVAGDVEGPRLADDPAWLLDALRYAVDCSVAPVDDGGTEVSCRLDLSGAEELDLSALLPPARFAGRIGPARRRRREESLRRVPCVVVLDAEGLIAWMAFGAPAADGVGMGWTTTEVVEYGVPVDLPDLMARSRPATWRGRKAHAAMPTR